MYIIKLEVKNAELIEVLFGAVPFSSKMNLDDALNGYLIQHVKQMHPYIPIRKKNVFTKEISVFDQVNDNEVLSWKLQEFKGRHFLSCGAGMQSTALALMSIENKFKGNIHPDIPIYDAIIYVMFKETDDVYNQVQFISELAEEAEIPFILLESKLYEDYMNNFGVKRVTSIPLWTSEKKELHTNMKMNIDDSGGLVLLEEKVIQEKKGRMLRNCTLDYKISRIQNFIKFELLCYSKYERIRQEDHKAHTMAIGFGFEEQKRAKENPNPMFINVYPLIEKKLERKHNYAYILETFGMKTFASACNICPYHRNFFYRYIKENDNRSYKEVIEFDKMLERQQPKSKIRAKLYISRSRKRIIDLTNEDCNDAETFHYNGQEIWNGF